MRAQNPPFPGKTGGSTASAAMPRPHSAVPLYTPDQRRRRDSSPWTLVQGVLAPIQFLVFCVSLVLVLRYLITGAGAEAAM